MSWNEDYKKIPFEKKLANLLRNSDWSVKGVRSALEKVGCQKSADLEEFCRELVNFCGDISTYPKLVKEIGFFFEYYQDFSVEEEFVADEPFMLVSGVLQSEVDKKKLISEVLEEIRINLENFPKTEEFSQPVKKLYSVGDLQQFLNVSLSELEFLSDYDHWERCRNSKKLENYHYSFIKKRNGIRLLEAPKTLLKECQKRINEHILKKLPVNPAACGYVSGKSVVDFADPHCGKKLILKLDLDHFFARIHRVQVERIFRSTGYSYFVSRFLTGLCTNLPPREISKRAGEVYNSSHLPQGAPTSPTLSNLCFAELDGKIADFAKSLGILYTRYADDMVFSCDESFDVKAVKEEIAKIICEHGHRLNASKTKILSRGGRQHICNVTVNDHVNCSRKYFDELKAILYNCVKFGPESQNRRNITNFRLHLLGRVNYVKQLNLRRGEKLMVLFEQICWP